MFARKDKILKFPFAALLLILLAHSPSLTHDAINSIAFDTVPPGIQLLSGAVTALLKAGFPYAR